MRISIFLVVFASLQSFALTNYAQSKKIDLKIEKTSVVSALNKIEDETEFFFFYNSSVVSKLDRTISIDLKAKTINELLDVIFKGTDVEYTINNRQIILSAKDQENSTNQQQKSVSGKVTDSTGELLPGVSVVVKGTTNGTTTDANGNYTISKVPENATLQFSFVGMKTQEVVVGDNSIINISLVDEYIGIEEVVAIGYGTMNRKNLTTSISKVSTDEVQKASSSNVAQLLLGRAAGLQATVASAQPGGNVNISIRGAGTPIYVVDGIVMPGNSLESGTGGSMTVVPNNVNRGGLAGLNPEDIESVEILKDAAASIYGIGASQGVILITTKKGKEGALKINYDGSYSAVSNYKYLDILTAPQYMGLVNVFNKEQYLYQNNMAPYGPTAYTSGWTAPYDAATIANAQTTDWKNLVLRNGSVSNHNISVNGGTKVVTYYVSGNYFSQTGTVSNSGMERFAIRSNVGVQLTPFIKLTSILNANRNNFNNSTVGGTSMGRGEQASGALAAALAFPPQTPVMDANGKYSGFLNFPNAVAMENMVDRTYSNGVYMNFAVDISIIKNMLNAKLLFGDNLENTRRTVFIPSYVYFDQIYKSRGNLSYDGRENQTMEAMVTYSKKFGSFLNFDAVAGVGRYLNSANGMSVAYDGQHDAIQNDNLGAITGVVTPGSYNAKDEKRSQFIRANFDILDRYVLATTLRRDGTDKFFPSKKYAFFPSVSAAWKISNESFMKGISWMNLLKLRVSYGETGSDNLGTALYGTYGPFVKTIMFSGNTVKYIPIIANGEDYPDVSWEKTTMKNIGLDFSIFRDRVSGSFDVFQNDVTDMLGYANTSGLSLFGTYPINGGHIQRKGWDARISTTNIKNPNFTWTSVLNLSRYNSIWKKRFPNYDYNTYEIKGEVPTNAVYFYETNGIINADKSNMPASQPAYAQKPGYPVIVDRNGDGKITTDDVKMINQVPDIYFGFGNTFTYKNFDLDIFMYASIGIKKYNYAWSWAYPLGLSAQYSNQNSYSYLLWNSQTNPNGTRPGIAYNLASSSLPGGAGTDIDYQDASFLRVRNITLGYNITSATLGVVGKYVSNIRVYVDAQNPFLFTKFDGFDPEIVSGGSYKGGKAEYPQTRTYTAGVKVTF